MCSCWGAGRGPSPPGGIWVVEPLGCCWCCCLRSPRWKHGRRPPPWLVQEGHTWEESQYSHYDIMTLWHPSYRIRHWDWVTSSRHFESSSNTTAMQIVQTWQKNMYNGAQIWFTVSRQVMAPWYDNRCVSVCENMPACRRWLHVKTCMPFNQVTDRTVRDVWDVTACTEDCRRATVC